MISNVLVITYLSAELKLYCQPDKLKDYIHIWFQSIEPYNDYHGLYHSHYYPLQNKDYHH